MGDQPPKIGAARQLWELDEEDVPETLEADPDGGQADV
jgi:hypothetical protein